MAQYLSDLPSVQDFSPPTPQAYFLLSKIFTFFPLVMFITWLFPQIQAMGRTSSQTSRLNLPGRYAWSLSELVSPLNMAYILTTLPSRPHPHPSSSSSILGTGLPIWNELLGLLFILHYANRAIIAPLFLAPSISPIHAGVALAMAIFNFVNSSCLGAWLCYSATSSSNSNATPVTPASSIPTILFGLSLFLLGLSGNIAAETTLFSLRRGAAKRKARSEGRVTVTYEKVYVIPPAEGWFKHVLYPHYVLEWLEWLGYAIAGYGAGLGFRGQPALWFLICEVAVMVPRARSGRVWYEGKFGRRALAGRGGSAPGGWF